MRLTGVRRNDPKSKAKGMILEKKGSPGKAKTKRFYEAEESRASVEGVLWVSKNRVTSSVAAEGKAEPMSTSVKMG